MLYCQTSMLISTNFKRMTHKYICPAAFLGRAVSQRAADNKDTQTVISIFIHHQLKARQQRMFLMLQHGSDTLVPMSCTNIYFPPLQQPW